MSTTWIQLDRHFPPEGLGFLTIILLEEDERPVRDQLNDRYAHGGGYRPISGFRIDNMTGTLHFPEDPPIRASAMTTIGDETVIFYAQGELLAIIQPDGSFEVTRVN